MVFVLACSVVVNSCTTRLFRGKPRDVICSREDGVVSTYYRDSFVAIAKVCSWGTESCGVVRDGESFENSNGAPAQGWSDRPGGWKFLPEESFRRRRRETRARTKLSASGGTLLGAATWRIVRNDAIDIQLDGLVDKDKVDWAANVVVDFWEGLAMPSSTLSLYR